MEKIKARIEMYQLALNGLSYRELTDWHKKQISSLKDKIEELEWVLKNLETPLDNTYDIPESSTELEYLNNCGVFQKDEAGIYFYISDNNTHGVNLTNLLYDYKKYLIALNEVERSKKA